MTAALAVVMVLCWIGWGVQRHVDMKLINLLEQKIEKLEKDRDHNH